MSTILTEANATTDAFYINVQPQRSQKKKNGRTSAGPARQKTLNAPTAGRTPTFMPKNDQFVLPQLTLLQVVLLKYSTVQ